MVAGMFTFSLFSSTGESKDFFFSLSLLKLISSEKNDVKHVLRLLYCGFKYSRYEVFNSDCAIHGLGVIRN